MIDQNAELAPIFFDVARNAAVTGRQVRDAWIADPSDENRHAMKVSVMVYEAAAQLAAGAEGVSVPEIHARVTEALAA